MCCRARYRVLGGVSVKKGLALFFMVVAFCLWAGNLRAQQAGSAGPAASAPSELNQRIVNLEKQVASAQSAGDNSWMLTSSALVLLMTGPGLALFYGGLVRRKNVLSTMMQSFAMMAVVTVLWAIVGYSIAFGSGTSFIGG